MSPSRAPVTAGIIAAIVMMFVAEVMNGVPAFGVSSEDLPALAKVGAMVPGMLATGQYWRLLSAMFIHIGLLHLILNLWALLQLGYAFEIMFGSQRMFVTWFVTGLVASLASAVFTNGFSAGASGAIFGVLGALIVSIRRSPRWRNERWTQMLSRQLIGWAAINVVIGFSVPGIDNAAHLGGFAAGLAMGLIPHRVPPPPPSSMVFDA